MAQSGVQVEVSWGCSGADWFRTVMTGDREQPANPRHRLPAIRIQVGRMGLSGAHAGDWFTFKRNP